MNVFLNLAGPEGLGIKHLKLRPGATRRQIQDGWSSACNRVQHTGLKDLIQDDVIDRDQVNFHMLAVSQVYGSHSATEAQPAIKTVKITDKKMKGRGC